MTIAVHISAPNPYKNSNVDFNYNCFSILAARFPEHHFIFIFDKPFHPLLLIQKNITPILSGPQIKNRLLQHYFYNFKIPRLLNKYNVSVFVCGTVCSLRTRISQCLIIGNLSFLQKINLSPDSDTRYLKRYAKAFFNKASGIAVLNDHLKTLLSRKYAIDDKKLNLLDIGIDKEFKRCLPGDCEQIKNRFTEGKEYFLYFSTCTSDNNNIITMLKAFSIFKKWQQSGMQLVILFSSANSGDIVKVLSTYKYRSDVKILTGETKIITAGVIAAAYAAFHLPVIEKTESQGLNALASDVPLVATDNPFCKSIYHDGALYAALTEKDISEKMMLLYKDEHTRSNLINKGKLVAEKHTWERTADQLWQLLQSAANNQTT